MIESRSGVDMDVLGDGNAVRGCLMPDPDSGVKDCVLKGDDGTCPAGCASCAQFRLEMSNWLRERQIETDNGS